MAMPQRQPGTLLPIQLETHQGFRRAGLPPPAPVPNSGLQAFHCRNGSWLPVTLPANKTRLRLGGDPYQCEIPVSGQGLDDLQAVLQQAGHHWYVVEVGRQRMMEINGFRYPQTVLAPGDSCLLRFGRAQVLLRLLEPGALAEPELRTVPPEGQPELGEYSLVGDAVAWRFPFERTVLIGSDSRCDLHLPGPVAFQALLSPHAGRLCLLNLAPEGHPPATADGEPALDPRPLRPGTRLNLGGGEYRLRLAKELRFVSEIELTEAELTGRFRLLQLDGQGQAVRSYPLPPEGGTVDLGRSPEHARIAVPDHGKLSRRHAQLITYARTVLILDNHSLNGTRVNGEPISRRNAHPGDILSFADLNFLLGYDETDR